MCDAIAAIVLAAGYIFATFYVLVTSNVSEVQRACGAVLWPFLLVHTAVLTGLALIGSGCMCYAQKWSHAFSSMDTTLMAGCFMLLFWCTSLGLGIPLVFNAYHSPACGNSKMGSGGGNDQGKGLVLVSAVALMIDAVLALLGLVAFGCFLTGDIQLESPRSQQQPQPHQKISLNKNKKLSQKNFE